MREAGPDLAALALAIAGDENFSHDPRAVHVNKDGSVDQGIFQINEFTARRRGLRDPLDALSNIREGVKILREGKRLYGTQAGTICYFEHPARCHQQ